MNIVERAKQITLQPAATWPIIEAEAHTPQSLFVPYLLILSAIPAVGSFIGMSIFGMGGFGVTIRVPLVNGLAMMITTYIMSLVMAFAMGWLVSALAPTFGGKSDLVSGLKVVVFGTTPMLLAGVLNLVPALSIIGLLVAIYSLYVIYLGLPVLMKNPKEKTVVYMVVLIIASIVAGVVLGLVSAMFTPSMSGMRMGSMGGPGGSATISTPMGDIKVDTSKAGATAPGTSGSSDNAALTIKTPDGEVKLDLQKMEEMAKKIEAAASAAQQAKKE